jgi:hypothetical protein
MRLKFYLTVIFVFAAAYSCLNAFVFLTREPWWFSFLGIFGTAAAIIALEVVLAQLCQSLFARVNPDSRFFKVHKWERHFYQFLGVRRWKEILPDVSAIKNKPKNKIEDTGSPEYIRGYLVESCIGDLVHIFCLVFANVVVFMFPFQYAIYFAIPCLIINVVLNVMPLMALRYNREVLARLYVKLCRTKAAQTAQNKG